MIDLFTVHFISMTTLFQKQEIQPEKPIRFWCNACIHDLLNNLIRTVFFAYFPKKTLFSLMESVLGLYVSNTRSARLTVYYSFMYENRESNYPFRCMLWCFDINLINLIVGSTLRTKYSDKHESIKHWFLFFNIDI